jgi:hypothetical protein
MAITNGYCTLADLKAALRIGTADTQDDAMLENCITASSRFIDGYANRMFWQAGSATARVFTARDSYFCFCDDFSTTTGFVLQTDTDGDGTFDTTWASTDVQLEPLNQILDGQTWAYYRLRAVGNYLFPTLEANFGEAAMVQVTARWGWPSVPEPVKQACILQSARVYKRYDSPLGVAGFGDLGAIRVSRFLDPDVAQMIEPFRKMQAFG